MTTSVTADNANRGVRKVSIERILIPLDGSGIAAGVLPVAGDLARRLSNYLKIRCENAWCVSLGK